MSMLSNIAGERSKVSVATDFYEALESRKSPSPLQNLSGVDLGVSSTLLPELQFLRNADILKYLRDHCSAKETPGNVKLLFIGPPRAGTCLRAFLSGSMLAKEEHIHEMCLILQSSCISTSANAV